MSDTIEDLVRIYVGSTPRDVFSTALGEDIAYTLAEMFGLAYQEIQRLAAGANLATATGLFLDQHAKDRGLRRQGDETDDQLRERLKKPPLAGTVPAILASLEPIIGIKAFLDLSTVTVNVTTVIEARQRGEIGNNIWIMFVPDGDGAGELERVGEYGLVFHYESGVTTVANFETAVDLSELIMVRTAGAADTLVDPDDTFGLTFLSGGYNPAILVELPRHGAFYDMGHCYDMGMRMGGGRGVVVVMIPEALDAKPAVSDAVRSKVSAGKIWLVEEYT